ncbi:hypothetical protein [Chitinophaga defluvii]|uniref:Uncharacterized protein n=1 Tax=Chitinophaga defluvii TaxID=3163343 RepID=A0ABV2T2G0_9BACT
MNIKKSLMAAVLLMGVSALTFAQAPAAKQTKKEATKKEAKAPATDTAHKAPVAHKAKAAKKA